MFALQTIYVLHDRLLPVIVFLHKDNPVEVVLTLDGKYLRVIDAAKFLHPTFRDGNRLLAVF
jgi:hypothetical protein